MVLNWNRIGLGSTYRKFFAMRVVKYCSSLPRDVVEGTPLETFKIRFDHSSALY